MPSYSQVLLAWVMAACRIIRIGRLSTVFASLKRTPHYFVPPWSTCPYHMHETSILWSKFLYYLFPVIVGWDVIYMQGNEIAKWMLQQQAVLMQSNSKSFRTNILITVKLESQCDEIWRFLMTCCPKRRRLHFLYEIFHSSSWKRIAVCWSKGALVFVREPS
jgi:hypothetical protein